MKPKILALIIILSLLLVTPVLIAQEESEEPGGEDEVFVEKTGKFSYEVALGIGSFNPSAVYDRNTGIDALMDQYVNYYNAAYTFTGEFPQSKFFIPFNFTLNYQLKEKIFLRAGIDFMTTGSGGNKVFQVTWDENNESHDYYIKNRVSCMMISAGAGYKYKEFDFYGALSVAFASLGRTETLDYSAAGYGHDIEDKFDGSGSGIGLMVGAKYWFDAKKLIKFKFLKRVKTFVKAELLLLSVGNITGTKERNAVNSAGDRSTQTIDGTFYHYGWNPYSQATFDYWDVSDSMPSDPTISGVEKLSLNLSGIRLMIGVSF
jgi:hypothetical protein